MGNDKFSMDKREADKQGLAQRWKADLRCFWESNRWLIIGVCWLFALGLGYTGFARQASQAGEARSPTTLIYLTLQLISMNSGAVPEPVPWQLNLARFLIPLLTAFTAFQAFALIFQEQLNRFRLGLIRDHVVICGLSHKGFALVKSFRQENRRVVVIERDEANDLLEPCRAYGAILILGDATDPQTLNRAAVGKANTLIAVSNDSINAEIAVQARQIMLAYPQNTLTCILHIVDPQLYDLLRDQELEMEAGSNFRLELFNVFERGAQILANQIPQIFTTRLDNKAPCLAIIGLGQLGQNLVVQVARTWWDASRPIPQPMCLLAIDLKANWKVEALQSRYPRLPQACELIPCEIDVREPAFQRGDFLPSGIDLRQVDLFYVCMDDDNLNLYTSLTLNRLAGAGGGPVVVRVTERVGLANLINRSALTALNQPENSEQSAESLPLRAFVLLEQTCTADLLLGGTHEILARELHAEYLRTQLAAGRQLYSSDVMAPWEELSAELKESNRQQVNRIAQKLKAIGCRLSPLTDWDAASFQFNPQEVEKMAQMEHDAWVEQLIRDGWRYGPGPKDPSARTHPDLVLWSVLPEAEKDKNRTAVRELPRLLARAGFQVERLHNVT